MLHGTLRTFARAALNFRRAVSLVTASALFLLPLELTTASVASAGDTQYPCTVTLTSGDPTGTPVQPPTCIDRSGNDQDEFLIPNTDRVVYATLPENATSIPGTHNTDGNSSVKIRGDYYDSAGIFVKGPVWTLTFNTAVTGREASNRFFATVHPATCDPTTGMTEVTLSATNVADRTDRYIPHVRFADYFRGDYGLEPSQFPYVTRVLDGTTMSVTAQYGPGTYLLKPGVRYGAGDFTVPTCGSYAAQPPHDPNHRQNADIHQRWHTTNVLVTFHNHVPRSTLFRVVINPEHGSNFVTRLRLARNKDATLTTEQWPPWTVVAADAKLKNAIGEWRWTSLRALTVKNPHKPERAAMSDSPSMTMPTEVSDPRRASGRA
jgi:hypothetical protein